MKHTLLTYSFIFLLVFGCKESTNNTDTNLTETKSTTVDQYVSIKVDFHGAKPPLMIDNIPWTQGMVIDSAMDRAQFIAPSFEFTYTANSPAGRFYTGIDSVFQDQSAQIYWFFCINDTLSSAGASATVLKPNDQVHWNYAKGDEVDCIKLNGNE